MSFVSARDGARIYYRVTGPKSGQPLVLIMGLGWDMSGWDRLMPHLDGFRVLRLDNRGTGRSDKPDRPYSIGGMAADVVKAMNAAGMEAAHVYGASLGSMIAQELAISYPARIRSLILGCPSPGIIAVPGAPGILRLIANREKLSPEEAFRRATPYLYSAALTEQPDAIEEVMRRRLASTVSPVGMRRQFQAVLRWSSLRRLRQIRVPTLVIHGDRDRVIPLANGRLIARLIPGARLRVLHGAGHVYGTDRPEEHRQALFSFLNEQPGTAGGEPDAERTVRVLEAG